MEQKKIDCIFCNLPSDRIIDHSKLSLVFRDAFPVTELHTLFIPRRHEPNWFELRGEEQGDIFELVGLHKSKLRAKDKTITGFNVGINIGKSAGQTVFHSHVHLIPRRDGDVENPRGGIRGVIPNKQKY